MRLSAIAFSFALSGCTTDLTIARVSADASPRDASESSVEVGFECPNEGKGPFMVNLGRFCVDTTEVTKAQYQAFLDSKPERAKQSPECLSNAKFEPTLDPGSPALCTAEKIDLARDPEHPVVCIDWCDAKAFCAWAGKRLCGAIEGGPEPFKDPAYVNVREKSQWYAACSGSGTKYPYGDTYKPGVCNGIDSFGGDASVAGTIAVATAPGCHGKAGTPWSAVHDMSGNVYEWVDDCQTPSGAVDPMTQSCIIRGGFFKEPEPWLACTWVEGVNGQQKQRGLFDDHIGIRCCAP